MAARNWIAQPGSQVIFLSCPIFECLYEGTRGPGKTSALLMDFAQHVGKGYGSAWKGILFRRTYPELADVITKSKEWFHSFFPGAEFNESKTTWTFPDGAQLLLRHMRVPDDYWSYHGHEYPWIGWEELTNWADDKCFRLMMSCSRSTMPGMPRKVRATTNPYGRGHNWVKKRYQLPHMRGRIVRTPGEPERVAIHGSVYENKLLLAADPEYISKIKAAARNPNELAAWLEGSWDITAGGMFDDVFYTNRHVVDQFPIPKNWYIDRSFDWGSSKPFSVGWWAEADGSPILLPSGKVFQTVRGDLFRIGEWYGCQKDEENVGLRMLAKDIATGIKHREIAMGLAGRVRPGPADSSIFSEENGVCIATDMALQGVRWTPADKSPGSRKHGWEAVRKVLKGSLNQDDEGKPKPGPREEPGMFIFKTCGHWLRTVPTLPRDDKDLDDVDTEAEDHAGDETRYRVRNKRQVARTGKF